MAPSYAFGPDGMPPSHMEAERALLGGLMANCDAFDRVADVVRSEMFADPVNGEIYAMIARGVEAGQRVDCVTLIAHYGDRVIFVGSPIETPMRLYLVDLLSAMVGIISLRDYARAVADTWHRRQLIDIGRDMVEQAMGGAEADGEPLEAGTVQETAEERLFAIANMRIEAGAAVSAGEAIREALDAAEAAAKRDGGMSGVPTGLQPLDALLGGIQPGQYVLLGARPSMGKTSVALAVAANAARCGHPVLFASAEMGAQQLGARLVSGLADLPGDYATRGMRRDRNALGQFVYEPLQQADWDAMVKVGRLASDPQRFPLTIDECRQRTMASIRTRARQMQRRGGLSLIVIDYLGMLRVPELARVGNRVLEIGRISRDAKALAKDLGVGVLMLSQLNRLVEGREDRRPRLSDLRDSGDLEQDADVVMFLHREHYYLKREPVTRRKGESDEKLSGRTSDWIKAVHEHKGRAKIFVDKNRMGSIGAVTVAFNEENGWISDLPLIGAY